MALGTACRTDVGYVLDILECWLWERHVGLTVEVILVPQLTNVLRAVDEGDRTTNQLLLSFCNELIPEPVLVVVLVQDRSSAVDVVVQWLVVVEHCQVRVRVLDLQLVARD